MCHYYILFKIISTYQTLVFNSCHDLLQKSVSFSGFAVVTVQKKTEIKIELTFGSWLKVRLWIRMKKWPERKSGQLRLWKKLFITFLLINTPETMTKQKKYNE